MPACTSIANHKGTNLASLGSPASPDRAMPNQNSHSPDISREFGGQEDVGYSPPPPTSPTSPESLVANDAAHELVRYGSLQGCWGFRFSDPLDFLIPIIVDDRISHSVIKLPKVQKKIYSRL
jgi:hypothetical protein